MVLDIETLIDLTADVTAAHLSNNPVPIGEVARLIETVFAALQALGAEPEPEAIKAPPRGAVSVRASITPAHLISLIDGKPYQTLKRHLTTHGYTPESYRKAFNLPYDYPMVAADYAARRSALALSLGLGRKREAEPLGSAKKPWARKVKAVNKD